jgi:hypothetical protein
MSGRIRADETEDDRLRSEADDIAVLLDELRLMVPPPAWSRIEDIVQRVVSLYSRGLGRVLDHARAAGAGANLDDRVSADDLLASLLVLHGLHPLDAEERIRRALLVVQARLGADAPSLELVTLDAHGGAHVRATGTIGGGSMSARVAEGVIRRAIEDAAPEVLRIEIAGLAPAASTPELIQIRRPREADR